MCFQQVWDFFRALVLRRHSLWSCNITRSVGLATSFALALHHYSLWSGWVWSCSITRSAKQGTRTLPLQFRTTAANRPVIINAKTYIFAKMIEQQASTSDRRTPLLPFTTTAASRHDSVISTTTSMRFIHRCARQRCCIAGPRLTVLCPRSPGPGTTRAGGIKSPPRRVSTTRPWHYAQVSCG